MKIPYYILFIGLIMIVGCHKKTDVRQYLVKITPIGNSDVPRTLFYISLRKNVIKEDGPFIDEILTDQNSLQNLVTFLEDHVPAKSSPHKMVGWGALKISVYNARKLVMDYYFFNSEESRYYLETLIKSLEKRNSDAKLIKDLREKGLSEIPFVYK